MIQKWQGDKSITSCQLGLTLHTNIFFFQISEFLPWMSCIVGAAKLGISTEAIGSNCGRIANKIIKTENEIN